MGEIANLRAEIEAELRRVVSEWEKRREYLNTSPDSYDRFFIFRSAEAVTALASHTSAPAEKDEEIARLREALKSARYYVEDAVIDDGGIDSCEIQHRATLEKIDAALGLDPVFPHPSTSKGE